MPKPSPSDLSPPDHGGALTKEKIRATIVGRSGEVRACYEAALQVWPTLTGRDVVRFVIGGDGRVATVRTGNSSLGNPALECCISTAVRGWRFEKPDRGGIVVVNFPFDLQYTR